MDTAQTCNILHLTDLHFGDPRQPASVEVLDKLKDYLFSFFTENEEREYWRPNFVAVSGDIAFDGNNRNHYSIAREFFESLSDSLNIAKEKFVFCPGNHDAQQENVYRTFVQKFNGDKKLDWETVVEEIFLDNKNNVSKLSANNFFYYSEFCREFYGDTKNPQPVYIGNDNKRENCKEFTSGVRIFDNVVFVVVNTAWFCIDHEVREKEILKNRTSDYGYLFAGHHFVTNCNRLLEAEFKDLDDSRDKYLIVTLMHHGFNWLHWTERYNNEKGSYVPTVKLITRLSDLVLNGHEHGEIHPPQLVNNSLVFNGGATYATKRDTKELYKMNFSILRIDPNKRYVQRLLFKYRPGEGHWISEPEYADGDVHREKTSIKHFMGRYIRSTLSKVDSPPRTKNLRSIFDNVSIPSDLILPQTDKIREKLLNLIYDTPTQRTKKDFGFTLPSQNSIDVIIYEDSPQNRVSIREILKSRIARNKNVDVIVYDVDTYRRPYKEAMNLRTQKRNEFTTWTKKLEYELPEVLIDTTLKTRLEFIDMDFLKTINN